MIVDPKMMLMYIGFLLTTRITHNIIHNFHDILPHLFLNFNKKFNYKNETIATENQATMN